MVYSPQLCEQQQTNFSVKHEVKLRFLPRETLLEDQFFIKDQVKIFSVLASKRTQKPFERSTS